MNLRLLLMLAALCGVTARAFPLGPTASDRGSADAAATAPTEYLTLNPGDQVDLSPGPVHFSGHPVLLKPTARKWLYRAAAPGHTKVRVGSPEHARTIVIFVAPTPSRQVSRHDLRWYRTQFEGGTSDCGPALVSMSILWAKGIDVPVRTVRSEIGYPFANGATSLENLRVAMGRHGISAHVTRVRTPSDLVAALERGHIALLLVRSDNIDMVSGDPTENLVGRYYAYGGGHYILVKGYSLDRDYFVVFDPYPSDWEANSLRYADGETMIGENRYYPAVQIIAALKTPDVLEVSAQ